MFVHPKIINGVMFSPQNKWSYGPPLLGTGVSGAHLVRDNFHPWNRGARVPSLASNQPDLVLAEAKTRWRRMFWLRMSGHSLDFFSFL